jgi:hypothetical protein
MIRRSLAREYRAAIIDQRQNQRRFDALVFGLDVVNHAAMLNVCIKSSYHFSIFKAGEKGRKQRTKPIKKLPQRFTSGQ